MEVSFSSPAYSTQDQKRDKSALRFLVKWYPKVLRWVVCLFERNIKITNRPGSFYVFLKEGLAGDPVVVDHAANGEHRQASVLEFPKLHGVHLVLGLSNGQSHGVKAQVAGLAVGVLEHGFHGDVSLVGPEFQDSHPKDDLEHGGGTNDRRGQVGVIDVLVSWKRDVLLHDESEGGEHGSTSVLDLGLPQPIHFHVSGKVEGIETNVTDPSLELVGSDEEGKGFGHFRVECGRSCRSGILGRQTKQRVQRNIMNIVRV